MTISPFCEMSANWPACTAPAKEMHATRTGIARRRILDAPDMFAPWENSVGEAPDGLKLATIVNLAMLIRREW
jgi:hypothetical protein